MKRYTLNDRHEDIKLLQRYLNEHFQLQMVVDGHMGRVTQSTLQRYQDKFSITERDSTGAVYGPITESYTAAFINRKYLKESDYVDAAKASGLEVNVIKAVKIVEALGMGFFNTGKPTILFERHIFYRQLVRTKGTGYADMIAKMHPDICNKATGGYIGGPSESNRLDTACTIDLICGLNSASYGLFQIMGFNHLRAGYKTVVDYYNAIGLGEREQLNAFINYMMLDADQSLIKSLKNKDFTAFAKEYNGPSYLKNKYDTKMLEAYKSLNQRK